MVPGGMFRHEGEGRTAAENRLLAGYLASVAGYVNVAGISSLGVSTSHATGNVARLVVALSEGQLTAAATVSLLIASFFAGAFFASLVIEANDPSRAPRTYGALLLTEALLFGLFLCAGTLLPATTPTRQDVLASLLCAAMGLQNSLVTRLSGAVVRTTHLTGVLTDLAIEAARWFRFARGTLEGRVRIRLSFGDRPLHRPDADKIALLATLLGAFVAGGVLGAVCTARLGRGALAVAVVATLVGAVYGLSGGRGLRLRAPGGDAAP